MSGLRFITSRIGVVTMAAGAMLLSGRSAVAQTRQPPAPVRPAPRRVPPPKEPSIAIRPFFLITGNRFAAQETFDAVFGHQVVPFWGGGVEVAFGAGLFVDATVSHWSGTGERVFTFEGDTFGLGTPLHASLTPIEFTGGWRFPTGQRHQVAPYVGGGIGSYHYSERSDFVDDTLDASHVGYHVVGGAEFKLTRTGTFRTAVDVQYTNVSGILGQGGVSQELGEDNLGGVAVRFRFVVGLK